MTPQELIARVGRALYGDFWRGPLAHDLGVSSRSVRYWLDGQHDIPPGVWRELRVIVAQRQKDLGDLLEQIPG